MCDLKELTVFLRASVYKHIKLERLGQMISIAFPALGL